MRSTQTRCLKNAVLPLLLPGCFIPAASLVDASCLHIAGAIARACMRGLCCFAWLGAVVFALNTTSLALLRRKKSCLPASCRSGLKEIKADCDCLALAHVTWVQPHPCAASVAYCMDYFSVLTSRFELDVSFWITGLFTGQVAIILPECLKRKDLASDNGLPSFICKRLYVPARAHAGAHGQNA